MIITANPEPEGSGELKLTAKDLFDDVYANFFSFSLEKNILWVLV